MLWKEVWACYNNTSVYSLNKPLELFAERALFFYWLWKLFIMNLTEMSKQGNARMRELQRGTIKTTGPSKSGNMPMDTKQVITCIIQQYLYKCSFCPCCYCVAKINRSMYNSALGLMLFHILLESDEQILAFHTMFALLASPCTHSLLLKNAGTPRPRSWCISWWEQIKAWWSITGWEEDKVHHLPTAPTQLLRF